MKSAVSVVRFVKHVMSAAALAFLLPSPPAAAQAPYLLPYTIQTLAGGGTALATGSPCANGVGISYDQYGDGCSVTSGSVVVGAQGADIHDVVVDQQGNVYFFDNGTNGLVRRIDARSGIITVYYGSFITQTACTATLDKYGDGCPANDGKANAAGGFTGGDAKGRGLSIAKNGDLYIASYSGNVIHRISVATGLTSEVAGFVTGTGKASLYTGAKGYTGDGGSALLADLNGPRGVAIDTAGNVYIADSANNVVRRVSAATGIITTISGNTGGGFGFSGDGGPASAALLYGPEDVEVDANGNIYIADFSNSRVRVIYNGGAVAAKLIAMTNPGTTATQGSIYTIMGNGVTPVTPVTNPGPVLATSVPVGSPRKIAVDSRGNVYLADNGNDVIWFLDATTGFMRVVAGTLSVTTGGTVCAQKTDGFGDNCPATQATLNPASTMGVSVDTFGQLYITDTGDARLRKVYTNQVFPATAAGVTASQVLEVHFAALDGPAAANAYTLSGSPDFAVTASTCTVNLDTTQDCLVTIGFKPTIGGSERASLAVTSLRSGTSVFGVTGTGVAASVALDPGTTTLLTAGLANPQGIALDSAGNTLIADTGNNRVIRLTGSTQTVLPGVGTLAAPSAVAVSPDGSIYIADTGNNVVRRVDPVTNALTVVAGGATAVCSTATDTFGDGCLGIAATLKAPAGLITDTDGNVFISDTGNNLIRELSASGYMSFVAGGATNACATGTDTLGDGCPPAQSIFKTPSALAIDAGRNLYVADTGSNEAREIVASTNLVQRVAGNQQPGSTGNTGTANVALLTAPTGIAVDAGGNVYIADTGNASIRVVSAGLINSIVGVFTAPGAGTLPGSAYTVQLTNPAGVVSSPSGRLTVLDSGNSRAFTDDRTGVTYNFGRTNIGSSSPTLQIQESSTGSATASLPTPFVATSGTGSAQFSVTPSGSNGCSSPIMLAPATACQLVAQFTPTMLGAAAATYMEAGTNTINTPAPFINLTGVGATLTTTTTTVTLPPVTQFAVPFTVTASVVPSSCNTAAPACIPTGTVTFYTVSAGGSPVAQGTPVAVDANGNAQKQISGLTVGRTSIYAVYSGDNFYASSTSMMVVAVIATGPTTTTVTASAQTSLQFTDLTLTATVSGPTSNRPTGTVSFYAGTTLLAQGTYKPSPALPVNVDPNTGKAVLMDIYYIDSMSGMPHYPQSFGLAAGSYAITAVYSGDANYAPSTSAVFQLTIAPDPTTFTLQTVANVGSLVTQSTAGTAQGSTGQLYLNVNPTNTFAGTVTFSCTGMPANSDCTFSPTSLTFAPVPGAAAFQQTQITFFTDVDPAVINNSTGDLHRPVLMGRSTNSVAFASMLGLPVLLLSLVTVFGFRRRLRSVRLLSVLALFGILAGGSAVLSGCGSGTSAPGSHLTPVGTYTVTIIAKGPASTVSVPVTFTVTAGVAGQL